jgi:hypothetical protein
MPPGRKEYGCCRRINSAIFEHGDIIIDVQSPAFDEDGASRRTLRGYATA